jgi:TatD DNase family protein
MATKAVEQEEDRLFKSLTELADAHCHLDLIQDFSLIKKAISSGVQTIITDGVDTSSNMKALELADNKNIFAALGMDPEHIIKLPKSELEKTIEFNIGLMHQNTNRIIGIGEVGLDYKDDKWKGVASLQKKVLKRLIGTAMELDLPISVHSRNSLPDIFDILNEMNARRVHLHYFEGDEKEARLAVERGYMISVPPIESSKRKRVIAVTPINNLMAESDSPAVGKSPSDVETSARLIALIKGITFEEAAMELTRNTKEFFGIEKKKRSSLIRI